LPQQGLAAYEDAELLGPIVTCNPPCQRPQSGTVAPGEKNSPAVVSTLSDPGLYESSGVVVCFRHCDDLPMLHARIVGYARCFQWNADQQPHIRRR